MYQFGCDYLVWDKVGVIDFVVFGCEDVYVYFKLELLVVDELCQVVVGGGKVLCWFEIEVIIVFGEVVVWVCKQFYVWFKLCVC